MNSTFKIENGSSRKSDSFYVEFLKLPENHGNTLGRQVASVSVPNMSFADSPIRMKGFTYHNKGDFSLGGLTITFHNDVEGKVEAILSVQILRQLNRTPDVLNQIDDHLKRDFKFDVKVTQYDQRNKPIRYLTYKNCFILDFSQDDFDLSSDTDRKIQIELACDDVDIELSGEILDLVGVVESESVFPTR